MAAPKKGLIGLLVGEPKPDGEGDSHEHDESDGEEADSGGKERLKRAFGRLREALDDGDDDAGAAALHDFVKACESAGYDEDDEKEEGGDDEGGEGDE